MGYGMTSIHASQSRMAHLLRAYSAQVAAPPSFTSVTVQELDRRADQREDQALLQQSKKTVLGIPEQMPSNGPMPAEAIQAPLTHGGMPVSLMRQLVFPPGTDIPSYTY